MTKKLILFTLPILAMLLTHCDDGNTISHFKNVNFNSGNSICEYLLLENGEQEYDTLSYFYLNFDNDSVSLLTGKCLDYRIDVNTKDQRVAWSVSYFLGKYTKNRWISKKLKRTDSLKTGSCLRKDQIGEKSFNMETPTIPELLMTKFEDGDSDKLYFIHSWLTKQKKIDTRKRLILVQLVATEAGNSLNVFSTK